MTTYSDAEWRVATTSRSRNLRSWWESSALRRRQVTLSLIAVIVACASFLNQHGLVIGALVLFSIAAGTIAWPVGAVVAGFSLMFLEWRRK